MREALFARVGHRCNFSVDAPFSTTPVDYSSLPWPLEKLRLTADFISSGREDQSYSAKCPKMPRILNCCVRWES
jgi:hypothetical protein